jgi:NAD+ kinase
VIVGVVAKPRHDKAGVVTKEVIAWLEQKGVSYRVGKEVAQVLSISKKSPEIVLERQLFTSVCDVVVVLGGDGTMISVCRYPSERPATILGVNLGTLGFLTEVTADELFDTLEKVLDGTARKEKHSLLDISVYQKNKTPITFHAINDVVITKEALARVYSVSVYVDDIFAAMIRGDGVIVSTPLGSTAYSLAAGGSIVHPLVEALLVTPICPHSLTTRPLVLPGKSKIKICIEKISQESKDEVFLTVDGQQGMELRESDEVTITTSKHYVYFVKSPVRTYFEVLGTKLKWANH